MIDQNNVNPADYGYFDDEPERMSLDESAPAAIATLIHAHLVETGRDAAGSRLLVGVARDEVSIQIETPGADGRLEPYRLPMHSEIEERLALARKSEDHLSLSYGTLEVDFGADFQSQRRAGGKLIDFHLGDIGLERSHFGLEHVVDQPTRLETVADALAEAHAAKLPAGTDRRYTLVVNDEEPYAYAVTTSFSGEPIPTRIQLNDSTKGRLIGMRDDEEGAHFSPIRANMRNSTIVNASKAPFIHDVKPGADERLEAALSAPPPGTMRRGLLDQAQGLIPTTRTSAKGPDAGPRHDPVQRDRGNGR